ncbi:integrase catalytic domain-containing protein [Trichonephila clavipes]|nr:integrase catalytic domain-containing protein [Trichonephila clavipes]
MDAETTTVLRGRVKAALTRTKNFTDKNDKNDVRKKSEKLELIYTEFDKADAALPIESSEMEEFETKYYETKDKLQNILENLSVRTYVYNDNSDVFENVSNMKSSNFKLPKINIERFSGDYKDWPAFKDLYVSLVHDNMCLSNIKKFQYLRGLLLAEPANIIKHIPITETAYNEAWEKLLCFSLIKTFMEQPSFNDINSSNLRNIADISDEVIRSLKSIDTKAESRDEDIYMDDLLSGSDTPNNAISICKDFAHVLSIRGFYLRKWNSNSTEFLAQFSEHSSHDTRVEFYKDSNESSEVLGLFWNLSNDTFAFQPSLELTPPLTKRADKTVELHGFADASSLAYAAAIYCRQKHNGKIKVKLLVSKTKVALVKQVSIPRLELYGAHLLSKLFKSVLRTLKHYTFDVFAWTDSKIVLSWLSSHPRKWKIFVANRTPEIMEVLPTKHWRHVPSKENPADIASRGIEPKCLTDCMLWWQGPPWLRLETSRWSKAESSCDEASDEEEKQSIKKQISLPTKSPVCSLHPFIDEHGLVRVGGRLQNSQLRLNSKHPIILPSQHSISELLIKEQHIAHLHAGPTFVTNSKHPPQLMGNLPKPRVTLERPSFSCGIDYAGTVLIKCNKGRGTKSTKGYIALFVCLATKAVHIEAVGDLTTDSFIAALHRFTARRGAPRHIYSDNGTNFVGARRKLDEIRKLWLSLRTNEAIPYYLSKSSIDWHFIPPSSPHFGGIWESGIRSVKFHLKRVLGETILTFEELTIVFTQIEGLLNSRPLSYVNDSDIECISALTPSHFLTGDVLLSVPEELPSTSSHRNRWELLQNIKRGFWKQWSADYLSSLEPRKKWQDTQPNLKEDDIVLIKEEGPPGTWPMARVLQVHPGNDGLVRGATVKSQDSVLKRPVHKLHKLPIYPN